MTAIMIWSVVVIITLIWRLVKHIKKEANELTNNEATVDRQTGGHIRHADMGKPGSGRNSRKRFCMGKVVWYDKNRLFGFIRQQNAKKGDIFFHKCNVKMTSASKISIGKSVKFIMVDTHQGMKAIKIKVLGDCIDNECVKSKGQQEVRLYGLDCIRITGDDGCVSLQDFKLSLHLYESYIDGEVELNEIYEHISCRCQTNNTSLIRRVTC